MKKKLLVTLVMLSLLLGLATPITAQAAVKISKSKVVLEVDAYLKLKVTGTKSSVTWKTSNKKVVKVAKTGTIKGIAEGTATVTATVGKKSYKCDVTVVNSNKNAGLGTRTNPYVLKKNPTFTIYSTQGNATASMKLEEVIDGEEANAKVEAENMFNEKPDGSNRWVLYHFKISYLTGDVELKGNDIVNSANLYNPDSTVSLGSVLPATFSDTLTSVLDTSLYAGASTDMWFGVLLDNDINYITFKTVGYDKNYKSYEQWFTTNLD